eukprot:GHUV01001573.1.p1 GENE.GHUV01001573.1~~GHUV01001573.1.p1  ORF type:complete len:362 (+),score=102.12 GHUV01001573.1:561-1646(+)
MPAEKQTFASAADHATSAASGTTRRSASFESSQPVRKFAITAVAGGKPDQDCPVMAPQQSFTLADIQSLTASNINRQYTDDDWYAAMSALDKLQKMQQQRGPQQQLYLQRNSPSVHDDGDDVWFSAHSHIVSTGSAVYLDADGSDVCKLAHDIKLQELSQQLTVTPCRELAVPTPDYVPTTPLLCGSKDWKFCPVDVKPFCFYWASDDLRSTPYPLPIDQLQKVNVISQKIHQSIPGSWFRVVGNQMLMHASPSLPGIPSAITNYTEYYNLDQTPSNWCLRRDLRVGKTIGQMFMTTSGILILRLCASGMFSSKMEWATEDYIRLEDNGETIVDRQVCKLMANGSVASQYLIGRKAGTAPP